jgi:large subunit ribosomal protein L29e
MSEFDGRTRTQFRKYCVCPYQTSGSDLWGWNSGITWKQMLFLFQSQALRRCGLLCRHSQVQEPHHTQPIPKMAELQTHKSLKELTPSSWGTRTLPRSTTARPEEDADTVNATSGWAEAIKAVWSLRWLSRVCQRPHRNLSRLAFPAHPKLGNWIWSYTAKDHRLWQPKPRGQTKTEAAAPAKAQLQLQLRLPKVPGPSEGLREKAAANVKSDGLLGHTYSHTVCRWPVTYTVFTSKLEVRSV